MSFITSYQELFKKPIYIHLLSGQEIDITSLKYSDIHLEDIKRSLFNICRFNGHSSCHYSVGEHSVNCFRAAVGDSDFYNYVGRDFPIFEGDKEFLRAVFAHDFSEAYCGDIITPIKKYLGKKFTRLEDKIHLALSKRFNIDFAKYKIAVKSIDSHVLNKELSLYKRKRPYLEDQVLKNMLDEADMLFKNIYKEYFDIICDKLDIK